MSKNCGHLSKQSEAHVKAFRAMKIFTALIVAMIIALFWWGSSDAHADVAVNASSSAEAIIECVFLMGVAVGFLISYVLDMIK